MDKYADLRAALADAQSADGDWVVPVIEVDTIRALLAERDALREALEMMVEMVEMNGFGRDYAIDVARAALAQERS